MSPPRAAVPLDGWLASLFDAAQIDDTCEVLAGASEPDPQADAREAALREEIKGCDNKLARYRSLVDKGGDEAIATKWITETQKERRVLEAQLGQHIPGGTMTPEQVKALVTSLHDIVAVLPADGAWASRRPCPGIPSGTPL